MPAFAFQSAAIKGVCHHCWTRRILKIPSVYDYLMNNGAEYFKAYLLSISISSLEDSLFRSTAYSWLACFLYILVFELCIVGINPMSGTLAFSHVCWLALRVLTEYVISCSHCAGLSLCTCAISPHIRQALLTFPHKFPARVLLHGTVLHHFCHL